MDNIFADLPAAADREIFTAIVSRSGARIERIVSTGQATPPDAPYDQDHDEWVMLLSGAAGLWLEGRGEMTLKPGDHLMIAAHCRHRVTWTAAGEATLWLAVHFD